MAKSTKDNTIDEKSPRPLSEPKEDVCDRRNTLNDLTNRQWMVETKSVWNSRAPRRDELKIEHPATFSEVDIERLVRFFTKEGAAVLDPFCGSGSTLLASGRAGRLATGVELVERWAEIAEKRLENEGLLQSQRVICGDARVELARMEACSFDYVVTSPPYWKILTKDLDHKTRVERAQKGLDTYYSEQKADLGNIEDYEEFLDCLQSVFAWCEKLLGHKKYMSVIVSDFRHKSEFVPYHMHISQVVENTGLDLEGITILAQDSKNLYPYGVPFAFVSNIHHQYILTFRKNGREKARP